MVTLGSVSELDAAVPAVAKKVVTFTPASETDTAFPLALKWVKTLTPAAETDVAVALSSVSGVAQRYVLDGSGGITSGVGAESGLIGVVD
jgi:hypothetical protein